MDSRTILCALLIAGTVSCSDDPNAPTESTPPDTSLAYADDDSVRAPHRAGKDYPADRVELDNAVLEYLEEAGTFERRPAFATVTPHAGFVYSGLVAASAFARVEIPDTVILVTPKHHGEGEPAAFWDDGPFIIPGHALEIRYDLVTRFMELAPEGEAIVDPVAFEQNQNHPLENQLPFLTTINPDVKIVPFTVYDNSQRDFRDWDVARLNAWGKSLADLVREIEAGGEKVLVVTSTDLVHRIPLAEAEIRDAKLMEYIVALDVQGLHDYVLEKEVTICGEIPVAITMAAAVELGYSKTELTGLDSSYHRQKNPDSVVGYGSAVFWKE